MFVTFPMCHCTTALLPYCPSSTSPLFTVLLFSGGALFVSDARFTAKDSAWVGNAVKSRAGGAVLGERGAIITMDTCVLAANAIQDSNGAGGAVYLRNKATLRATGKCVCCWWCRYCLNDEN